MPGKIKLRRTSSAVVATYDIFTTSLRLANVPLPNVQIDGKDLSPILFDEDESSPHDCITTRARRGCNALMSIPSAQVCGQLGAADISSTTSRQIGLRVPTTASFMTPLIYDLDADPGENPLRGV